MAASGSRNAPPPAPLFALGATEEGYVAGPSNNIAITVPAGFENIPTFNIRNGEPSEARSILVRPTIPAAYHWASVGGVPHAKALQCVEAYIRAALAQIRNNMPADMTAEKAKKVAIVLGVARAVMTCYYRLTDADLIGGEKAPTRINATVAADGSISFQSLVANNSTLKDYLTGPLNLSDADRDVIPALVSCSIGIPALQGYSLMMTGHHYISTGDSQSKKVYTVVERQFWKSSAVATWFSADTEMVSDALWHKAGHPLNMSLKMTVAQSQSVADMIRESGAGSAASRLPALEPTLRGAGSYITLMQTIDTVLNDVDSSMDMGFFPTIVDLVKAWPAGADRPQGDETFNSLIPASYRTRADAVKYVQSLMDRNAAKVAWCYGFFTALCDNNMSVGAGTNTLKSSNSLSKLKNQAFASYTMGVLAHGDMAAIKGARRRDGDIRIPRFVFDCGVEVAEAERAGA